MADAKTALIALGGAPDSGGDGLPNIPAVPATDNSALNNILASMKLWMEKASGQGLSAFAKKSEMVQAGVMAPVDGSTVIKPIVGNMATPPVPKALSATGAMTNIFLTWDDPADSYGNHAYTEIWSSETDSFTNAVMVGQSAGFVFAHSVGEDSTRYYWIRFVSTTGVQGPFNSVNGKKGNTAQNPAYLMDVLTDEYGVTSESPFFQLDYPQEINGVTVPAGTYMKTAFIHNAAITNAMIGDLSADKITTGKLTADRIDGTNLRVVNGTFSGSLQAATGTFAGALSAATGTFTGALSAATGTFSGRLTAGTLDPSVFAGRVFTYNTPGVYTITVPTDTGWSSISIRFTLQGAGGGGGGVQSVRRPAGAGGGGAGSEITITVNNLTPGQTYTLVVGAGGGGGYGYANGAAGGATTLLGYSASGGAGGGGALSGENSVGIGAGGSIGGQSGYAYWELMGVGQAYGGAGGSSVYGSGGERTYPPQGWGATGLVGGIGAGGSGASSFFTENYNFGGGAGGGGYALIEFFDPNAVVTNTRYQNLIAWLDTNGHGAVPQNAR